MQKSVLFVLLSVMGVTSVLSGCATGSGYVTLSYLPQYNVARVPGGNCVARRSLSLISAPFGTGSAPGKT